MANLEWYRSFAHVYRAGTVSAAARTLHLTQPAVSQHIAALEVAVGQKLFVRARTRMEPTERGKLLYTRVADAIERLESLSGAAAGIRQQDVLRLGAPSEFFATHVVDRLDRAAGVRYVVSLDMASALLDQLTDGTLDAVVSTQKIPRAEIVYRGVFEETFWLVGPADARKVATRSLDAWARTQPWIAYGPELPLIRRFWRQVFDTRLDITPKLTVPDLRAMRRAVECGLGISVLPDYLCRDAVEAGRLTLLLRPTPPVINELWLALPRGQLAHPRVRAMLEALRTD